MSSTDKQTVLQDPLGHLLGYQMRRAAFATLLPLNEAFEQLGVSPTEAIVIRFVRANPGCTQAEIGRAIGVKRTNMVPVAHGLIAKRLLERTAADGRSHSLFLTQSGDALLRKINEAASTHEEFFFGDIPDDVRRILLQAFQLLRARAEQWEPRE
jgi:DNA-binding MarR family transcriptional regulator